MPPSWSCLSNKCKWLGIKQKPKTSTNLSLLSSSIGPPSAESAEGGPRGVIHCFTGNWTQAKQYLDLGLYLGFNGIIFKHNVDEIIKKAPLNRMLIETDCPYLTPPQAKTERNEPIFVKYVAERVAELRGTSFEEIAEATTQNAKTLFNLT